MTPEQTRDAIVVALRRDLLGPLADPEGQYPGAAITRVRRGQLIGRPSELHTLLIAHDGEEVLAVESPTARYIVGALYPVLRGDEERDLDEEQTPGVTDAGEDLAEVSPRPAEPGPAIDIADIGEDLVADTPFDRPGRPSSCGMSFVVTSSETRLTLTVSGGRYEPFPLVVMGADRIAWHRVPVHAQLEVQLPADGSKIHKVERIVVEAMRLEVGAHVRATVDGRRIVTCYLVNRTPAGPTLPERVLFAATLAADLAPGALCDYPDRDADTSSEAASLRLLYSTQPVRAVGHGVDAVVVDNDDGVTVRTEALPVARVTGTTPDVGDDAGSLAIDMDALGRWEPGAVAKVERLLASYRGWIKDRRAATAALSGQARSTAEGHMRDCRAFADDIEAGWRLAHTDPTVGQCLRWASLAMAAQRRSYAAATRQIHVDEQTHAVRVEGSEPCGIGTESGGIGTARWRPFQLVFVLANLAPVTDPTHRRRGVVDVIWMPTGGGKTEAYLALAAFTMLYRRCVHPNSGGTAVIMRYTLRLLTAQQLQRAASLLCALELLRVESKGGLGQERFSIGAWLGRASTPNWRKDALAMLRRLAEKRRGAGRPFLLSRCPACATAMGDVVDRQVLGYSAQSISSGNRMQASCPNPSCAFHLGRNPAGLPVYEVDEDIYDKPPTFLVATVDKFAQLAWNEKARVLFGISPTGARLNRAPELVIQDELHLISGPLGSLVGLYESALDHLCRHDAGLPPHVVAATATTRAYARQAEALYACPANDVRLVPPPGLSVDDSFFAQVQTVTAPQTFVGVCATGVGRFSHAQMRVLASLAHAAAALEVGDAPVDPYWTNVMFFGAMRDLGQAKALIATDLRGYAWRLVRATGIRTGAHRSDGTRLAIRTLNDVELTSASSSAAAEALERLACQRGESGCVDLALATSVIEVGVDIDRLGLLTIIRQPKTAAQYIQVAGRVGRDALNGPGLVVVLLNPLTTRDISHYERFTSVHQRFYAAVEPASVTPFTDAALTRGLRGTLAAIVRQIRPIGSSAVTDDDLHRIRHAAASIVIRARALVGSVQPRLQALADAVVHEAEVAADQQLAWGVAGKSRAQFLRPLEDPAPEDTASWAVLTSLRSVDADAALRIDEDWLPASSGHAPVDESAARAANADPEESW